MRTRGLRRPIEYAILIGAYDTPASIGLPNALLVVHLTTAHVWSLWRLGPSLARRQDPSPDFASLA
jgi:hypothetical protein